MTKKEFINNCCEMYEIDKSSTLPYAGITDFLGEVYDIYFKPNFWLCSGIAPSGSELYAGTYDPELAKKWAESNFVYPCIRVKEKK